MLFAIDIISFRTLSTRSSCEKINVCKVLTVGCCRGDAGQWSRSVSAWAPEGWARAGRAARGAGTTRVRPTAPSAGATDATAAIGATDATAVIGVSAATDAIGASPACTPGWRQRRWARRS